MKNSLLRNSARSRLILVLLPALLTGCGPDYSPIGTGMIAIGVCIVIYGIVGALAELIKDEQSKSEPPPPKRPRKRASTKGREEQP